jgi:hypothetical protein
MNEDEAEAILDDIESASPEELHDALIVAGIEESPAEEIVDLVAMARSMMHLGVLIIVVEGLVFAVMAWSHQYVMMPTIVWSVAVVAFLCGRNYEKGKNS